MNPQEVAMLLTMSAAVDDRIDPDQMRIAMWCETLTKSMPFDFAKSFLIKHYSKQKSVMMPADFNEAWRIEHNKREAERADREIEASRNFAVPIPPEVKKRLLALQRNLSS